MAIVLLGQSECSICGEVLDEGEDIVMSPAFVESDDDPLWPFSDSGMHRACFEEWPLRKKFVDSFNDYYMRHYRGMRRMNPNGEIVERDLG